MCIGKGVAQSHSTYDELYYRRLRQIQAELRRRNASTLFVVPQRRQPHQPTVLNCIDHCAEFAKGCREGRYRHRAQGGSRSVCFQLVPKCPACHSTNVEEPLARLKQTPFVCVACGAKW